jgi:hypothetical protein
MLPLSSPVIFHCALNCGYDFFMMSESSPNETGTVKSATTASSGKTVNNITTTEITMNDIYIRSPPT